MRREKIPVIGNEVENPLDSMRSVADTYSEYKPAEKPIIVYVPKHEYDHFGAEAVHRPPH